MKKNIFFLNVKHKVTDAGNTEQLVALYYINKFCFSFKGEYWRTKKKTILDLMCYLKGPCHQKLSFSMLNSHGTDNYVIGLLFQKLKKNKKYIFAKISRDSVYLKNVYRKRKMYLKNAYQKRKVYRKNAYQNFFNSQTVYRKRIWFSNIVTHKIL